jgi:hypothetical protein
MNPYYYDIEEDIFSEDLKQYVIKNSLANTDKFIAYAGALNKLIDGNNFYFGNMISQHPEIIKVVNSCTLKCYPVVLLHKPNAKILKHVDDPNKRNCVLITPLYPNENYTPTWFWKKEGGFLDWQKNELELMATCSFPNMKPAFLNTQQVHSLETSDSYRINLQLCFDDPFEAVVSKYIAGELFKK